jgi:hypothetical protein
MRKDGIGTIRLTRTEPEASAAPGDRRVLLRFYPRPRFCCTSDSPMAVCHSARPQSAVSQMAASPFVISLPIPQASLAGHPGGAPQMRAAAATEFEGR